MIIGIDPGASGGIAFWDEARVECFKMPETERDVFDLLEDVRFLNVDVFLERVHSMPKQGVSSTFTFGKNYGFLRGAITALRYTLHDVTPQKWQKALGCLTHGDKNVSKQMAQQLFPQLKITHATADALLIMEYGRRTLV
jgi:Holliday junction resolvasome RuvABC endonuclease subunit